MNTTKTYAAKSSVTRALKAAGLNPELYTIEATDGGFFGQIIPVVTKKEATGEKKPRNGNCKAVWDMAASMPGAKRKEVIDACVAAGINMGTAKTQYQQWFASSRG